MSGAANFGRCSDFRVCNGLIVGGKQILDADRNLSGLKSITSKGISINGMITSPVVVSEDVLCGNVLIVSSTADRQVQNVSSSTDTTIIGVAASNAAAGESVDMIIGGEFKVRKTGSVSRGDFLASSGDLGLAESTGTDGATGDFAIATSDANAEMEFVWARFKKAEVY